MSVKNSIVKIENDFSFIFKMKEISLGIIFKINLALNKYISILALNINFFNNINKILYVEIKGNIERIKINKSRKIHIIKELNIVLIEIEPNKDKIKLDNNFLELDDENYFNKEYIRNINPKKNIYKFKNDNKCILIQKEKYDHCIYPILSPKNNKIIGFESENNRYFFNKEYYLIYININNFEKKKKKKKPTEIRIIYKIIKGKKTKIFGKKFVEKNHLNCHLIIDGNIESLSEYLEEKYIDKDYNLEVKLIITKQITDLSYMFNDCNSLISLANLSKIDTTNVVDMSSLFSGCFSLKYLTGLSKWNTINVKDMSYIFNFCKKYLEIQILG